MNNSEIVYSVGASCINKDWFSMDMESVWKIMEDYLWFIGRNYRLQLHCFVLMSNHYHMLASAPEGNLPSAMQYFQTQTSKCIGKESDRINHIWRAKYFRSMVLGTNYYLCAYKYFYRNPVKAKICNRVEDYRFSTLHGLLGRSQLIIPVAYDHTLFSDVEGTLTWLNRSPKEGYEDCIRKGIRRKVFGIPRDPHTGMAHPLEQELF